MAKRVRIVWPALFALLAAGGFAAWRLAQADWDPLALATLGTRYRDGDPTGAPGYDGQFAYYIAMDLSPEEAAGHLDVPAYRYQRILLPVLAAILSFGNDAAIPWALLAVNLVAHFSGTWALAAWLDGHGRWPGFALAYGLWVGLVAGVGLDLTEPLAFALLSAAWLARSRSRPGLGAALIGLSLFAKETGVFFWAAGLIGDVILHVPRRRLAHLVAAGGAFALWQLILWRLFGQPGIGSGGEMATPFEWIPFMGFFRIGLVEPAALALFGVIFGPTIVLPAIWGIVAAARQLARKGSSPEAWALLLNAGAIPFLPFSTFREPLGLVRVASGLVLATVLFSSAHRMKRPLVYALVWSVLLAMLLNG